MKRIDWAAARRRIEHARAEFDELVRTSMREVMEKTEEHRRWGFGDGGRWHFEMASRLLTWVSPDGRVRQADAQIVGTLHRAHGSWAWAWSNRTIDVALQQASLAARRWGASRGIMELVEPCFCASEHDAWHFAAVAAKLHGLECTYRTPWDPGDRLLMYFAFGPLRTTEVQ